MNSASDAIHADAGTDWKAYMDGLAHKRRMGFLTKWPLYERFKAGDQWPAATERTKNLPRPVFNIIEMVQGHKVSSVMNEQIKMSFSSQDDDPNAESGSDMFSRYSETFWETVKQDELNEECLEDGSNRGTSIWHYYMDMSINGGNNVPWVGQLCGENIDVMNFFPGNPQQRNVQKQPYNIISSREDVDAVKKTAGMNGLTPEMISMIKPDKETLNEGYDSAQVELVDSSKVTILTRYWKADDGFIWFRKCASGLVIKPDTSTNRKLYPIAVMQWKRRKKSFFGVGDTEGLIPNQRTINFLMAMQVLSVQLTGWPKLLYKKNAIDPTKVKNIPGEMVRDDYDGQGSGVSYLQPGNMTNMAQMLVQNFMDYTKELTGAHDAATGQAPSSQLNATAIMLLQKASGVPIESIKRRFYQAMEDIGRIWEEFWKVNYNLQRPIKVKNQEQKDEVVQFTGSDYADLGFNLKIDIGPSSTYSESLMMSSLDHFLDKGYVTFPQYLKYAPKNVVPFKDRLLQEIEKQHQEDLLNTLINLPPQVLQMLQAADPQVRQQMLDQITAQMKQQPVQPAPMPPQQQAPAPAMA